jgi:hypothetical protein
MNKNRINEVLNPIDKPVINPLDSTPGTKYPPKNKIEDNVLRNTIAPYSAKKKNTKGNAEYSVINPAVNSDSDSGKSKGALLLSANIAIKNINAIGNNAIEYTK